MTKPGECVPDEGHACWERVVQLRDDEVPRAFDPFALTDALDRLSDVWRMVFGERILVLASNTDSALLSHPAASRADLVDRLRALAEIIGDFKVPDELLPSDLGDEYRIGSLNRVESAVRVRMDPEEVSVVSEPIRQLRLLLRLDNAFSHPTGELPKLWPELGVSYPPPDWDTAWLTVQTNAVRALRSLATVVRALAD